MYMFLKLANSEMEKGIHFFFKCPLTKFIYSGNWKLEKTPLKGTKITQT